MGIFSRHAETIALRESSKPRLYGTQEETDATKPLKKARIIERLLAGRTFKEIAEETGMHRDTVTKYAKERDVIEELTEHYKARREALVRELDGGVLDAIRYLKQVMGDDTRSTRDRIRAATEILDRGEVPRGVRLEVNNAGTGTTIDIPDVSVLSDAEVEEAARLILARRERITVPV